MLCYLVMYKESHTTYAVRVESKRTPTSLPTVLQFNCPTLAAAEHLIDAMTEIGVVRERDLIFDI